MTVTATIAEPARRKWFPFGMPLRSARIRVFALPHAGGGASMFRPWRDLAPEGFDICPLQLPGRETRLVEAAVADPDALLDALRDALTPFLGEPYALLGHSLGGLLAFTLGQRLEQEGFAPPEAMILAACAPGQRPPRGVADWSEDELARYVRHVRGTPDVVLDDPDLRSLVLPRMRADLMLVDQILERLAGQVSCPIIAIGGTCDIGLPAAAIARWSEHTSAASTLHLAAGDHFFPRDRTVVEELVARLPQWLPNALAKRANL